MTHRLPFIALLSIGLIAGACQDSPTATVTPTGETLSAEIAQEITGTSEGQRPLLQRLFSQSLRKVSAEQGREGVARITSGLAELRRAAADAATAGDRRAARAAREAMQLETARIVIVVHGDHLVDRVLAAGGSQLARIDNRLAQARENGGDVVRFQTAASRLRGVLNSARDAAASGDSARALVLGASVIDAAGKIFTRG